MESGLPKSLKEFVASKGPYKQKDLYQEFKEIHSMSHPYFHNIMDGNSPPTLILICFIWMKFGDPTSESDVSFLESQIKSCSFIRDSFPPTLSKISDEVVKTIVNYLVGG